jgi:hypothetical protein
MFHRQARKQRKEDESRRWDPAWFAPGSEPGRIRPGWADSYFSFFDLAQVNSSSPVQAHGGFSGWPTQIEGKTRNILSEYSHTWSSARAETRTTSALLLRVPVTRGPANRARRVGDEESGEAMKTRKSAQERMNYLRLDARGLSIRDHYQKWHPSLVKSLEKRGEAEAFFLRRQEGYHAQEDRLAKKNLPAGGADEILRELYYPLSDKEQRILES